MRNSHKLIFASILVMLFAMKADVATFIPQWIKLAIAGVLLVMGLYTMWKERKW